MATVLESPSGYYRISLPDSKDWALRELYRFPRAYEQCYSFVYCLDLELPERDRERVDYAFSSYPFKGGYSYVNIYSVLYSQLPPKARPRIKSIHKASPGWLDLFLNLDAAIALAKAIGALSVAGATAVTAYAKSVKIIRSLNVNREESRLRELQLTTRQIKAINASCEALSKSIGFKNLAELHRRTGDSVTSLKLLAAQYRRMKELLDFTNKNKAILPLVAKSSEIKTVQRVTQKRVLRIRRS